MGIMKASTLACGCGSHSDYKIAAQRTAEVRRATPQYIRGLSPTTPLLADDDLWVGRDLK